MTENDPPWAPSAAGSAAGGGGRRGAWANHGKPWGCKAMGTKALQDDAMLARLLDL